MNNIIPEKKRHNKFYALLSATLNQIDTSGYCAFYNYEQITIFLRTDTDSFICYLDNFFRGYFDCSDKNSPDIIIYISTSPQFIDFLEDIIVMDIDEAQQKNFIATSFPLIIQVNRKGGLKERSDFVVYSVVDPSKKAVLFLVSQFATNKEHQIMRIIRTVTEELMVEKYAGVVLHGAGIVQQGKGIAIIGERFAGKTTTLMNALQYGRFDFLANDKIFLIPNQATFTMHGLPISIGIRDGTIKLLPEIQKFLEGIAPSEIDSRVYLKPQHFCKLFNCAITCTAEISCFAAPEYLPGIQKSQLIRCSEEEAREILYKNMLEASSSPYPKHFTLNHQYQSVKNIRKFLIEVSQQVPVYRLLQNSKTNAYSISLLHNLINS